MANSALYNRLGSGKAGVDGPVLWQTMPFAFLTIKIKLAGSFEILQSLLIVGNGKSTCPLAQLNWSSVGAGQSSFTLWILGAVNSTGFSSQVICASHPVPFELSPFVWNINVRQPELLIDGSQSAPIHPPKALLTAKPAAVSKEGEGSAFNVFTLPW